MTSLTGIDARHVNTYHYHPGLLFQFILAEFTESFAEIRRLQSLINASAVTREDELIQSRNPALAEELEESLTRLVGAQKDCMRLFSWNLHEGILAKLKTYCSLFLHNADSDEKELIGLQHYAEKAWQYCLQAVDILNDKRTENGALAIALDKTSGAMGRFAKLIGRLLHQFRDDENVIFFVVRQHQLFDKLYGSRFVNKLLVRLYSKGLHEARHFLEQRYEARGFGHLLPVIQASIAEIEAAAQ